MLHIGCANIGAAGVAEVDDPEFTGVVIITPLLPILISQRERPPDFRTGKRRLREGRLLGRGIAGCEQQRSGKHYNKFIHDAASNGLVKAQYQDSFIESGTVNMRNSSTGFTSGKLAIAVIALSMFAAPVAAQFSDSYNFLKAVKDRKGEDAEKYINVPGSGAVIINTKSDDTGETALHIVTARRDYDWLGYLLSKGAKADIADKKGATPLMLATQLGWSDGAQLLIDRKALVDATNRSGETALIRAVQLRNSEMVRLLMKAGANADKQDSVAGYSARDYALQDGRGSAILAIIESGGKSDAPTIAPKTKTGDLDFSGIEEKPVTQDKPKAQ